MPIHHDPAAAPGLPNDHFLLPFARRTGGDVAFDGNEPRRPARIIGFPPPAADRCRMMAELAKAVAARLEQGHVKLLEAASELLELSDFDFATRMRSMMIDDAGRALLSDLLGSAQGAAVDFDRGSRVLFVLRARLSAGLGTTGGVDGR